MMTQAFLATLSQITPCETPLGPISEPIASSTNLTFFILALRLNSLIKDKKGKSF